MEGRFRCVALVVASSCGGGPRAAATTEPTSREDEDVVVESPAAPNAISDAPTQVQAWVADHAIAIDGVEAGRGFADLEPLRDVVGDARIVALGESTHGTREFFQLKHRMVEYLVTELGFTLFAIEGSMAEAFAIDRYVVAGVGDPRAALAGLRFWTWDTEEVLAMIEWMRRYNADASHPSKVRFYGVDMQFAPRAAEVALAYLAKVEPTRAAALRRRLAPLSNSFLLEGPIDWSTSELRAVAASVQTLARRFEDRRARWIGATSEDAYELARQHVRLLEQFVDLYTRPEQTVSAGLASRDRGLAANVEWILDRHPTEKVVLWAHNTHVGTDPHLHASMGAHLRKTHGDALVVIGLVFGRGEFHARDLADVSYGVRTFRVEDPRHDSLEALLASTGLPVLGLDLRALPPEGSARAWLGLDRPTRVIGATFHDGGDRMSFWSQTATERYDVVLFVRDASASTLNESAQRPSLVPLGAPENLDFETGTVGMVPPSWIISPRALADGFTAHTSTTCELEGHRCASVRRTDTESIAGYGALMQLLVAEDYAGKRVRIGASVRSTTAGPGDVAYLWVRTDAPSDGRLVASESSRISIASSDWTTQTVEAYVPPHARALSFGIALVGTGEVSMDDVVLTVTDGTSAAGRSD